MPNTYTQIHIQAVFAVRFRAGLLRDAWREDLHQYITGIVRKQGHKMLCIDSVDDHMHVLLACALCPVQSLSDLMQDIKGGSSEWINSKRFSPYRFEWQQAFSAFSYSRSDLPKVIAYIRNQQEHHKTETFLDEYRRMLKMFDIDCDERYIFTEPV